MADQKRIWRLGIDVGGTNTDAVVIDGDLKLVAATKSPTTEDVMSGIVAAMHEVITQIGADAARNIGFAMLGTTHCTNAIVERKRLNKVAALRVGAPATSSTVARSARCRKTRSARSRASCAKRASSPWP